MILGKKPEQRGRPHITVVLAMSLDGKIADVRRSPARFGSPRDKAHLEARFAEADGVLFGAATLRAYGTTLPLTHPNLLQQRQDEGRSPQPVHIVCSRTAEFDPDLRFFRQPVPRWLLTTPTGGDRWQSRTEFDRIFALPATPTGLDWRQALADLTQAGIRRLVLAGGGELVAALVAADAVDELWLTVCPLLLGGRDAPTPVGGDGWLEAAAPRLELLSAEAIAQEVFLHYRLHRAAD
ncbi:MAG: dihydrofolate reductase family protein [Cyanobacteria bacterium J069]|nr:MAG: RibD family protein [Cyanobacteria bacterium J069]